MFAVSCKSTAILPLCGQVRTMATLKDISTRLKSVKNIQKITQSMKMVSAAKFSRAERDLKAARPYGDGAQAFYKCAEVQPGATEQPSQLIVAVTSDRGLCGGVHSNICKAVRTIISEKSASEKENTKIICLGDKSKAILGRMFGKHVLMSFNDLGKKPPSFSDATIVAEAIMNSGFDFSEGTIIYNRFKSVVSYNTKTMPVFGLESILKADKISLYDSLDNEVIQSFQEYALASLIYYAFKESATSEQSSRMTSMDNATKNAGEMIEKLTLTFNRTRQSVITRELIEIISGAAAL